MAGITSVLLVMMLSGPRVFLAMARDGLVPKGFFGDVHPRFRTPWKSTILIGVFVCVLAGFLPIDALLHLTNIGTLFAFVDRLRRGAHHAQEAPRTPSGPSAARWCRSSRSWASCCCLMLMFSLPADNWWRLVVWLAIGLVIYFLYSRKHSVMKHHLDHQIAKHGLTPAGTIDTHPEDR